MRNIEVDVRLVAATNADLESAVEAGRFRRDLFFRLNVIHIDIPPLRQRRDDIPLLVARFVAAVARENDLRPVRFSREAMDLLLSHHWPGNIRELRNLVEKVAVLYAGREIGAELIEEAVARRIRRGGNLPAVLSGPRDDADRELIYRTLLALRAEIAEIKAHLAAGRVDRLGRAGAEFASSAARGNAEYGEMEMVEPIVTEVPEDAEAGRGAWAGAGGEAAEGEGNRSPRDEPPLTLAELERDAIARALQRTGGNRRRAARLLGIGERTLYRKIHEYRIQGKGAPGGRGPR
jgi:DNA-binding NtrC family response regulator